MYSGNRELIEMAEGCIPDDPEGAVLKIMEGQNARKLFDEKRREGRSISMALSDDEMKKCAGFAQAAEEMLKKDDPRTAGLKSFLKDKSSDKWTVFADRALNPKAEEEAILPPEGKNAPGKNIANQKNKEPLRKNLENRRSL